MANRWSTTRANGMPKKAPARVETIFVRKGLSDQNPVASPHMLKTEVRQPAMGEMTMVPRRTGPLSSQMRFRMEPTPTATRNQRMRCRSKCFKRAIKILNDRDLGAAVRAPRDRGELGSHEAGSAEPSNESP